MSVTKTNVPPLLSFTSLHSAPQSLSTELSALGSELACQGPKVTGALGSECAQQCVDGVTRVLSVVQAALAKSEEELRSLQQDSVEKQVRRKVFTVDSMT